MPTLISKKVNGHKLWYVVENHRINGKNKREYIESLGQVSKTEAQFALSKYLLKKKNIVSGKVLFGDIYIEFLEMYRKKTDVKPRTIRNFEDMSRHFLDLFRHRHIKEIAFSDIEELKVSCSKKGLSNRSVNIVLIELKKVLKFAIQKNALDSLPLIQPLSITRQNTIDRLTINQINTLLSKADNKQAFYIKLMLHSGMRPNEAINLKWSDINLEQGYINVTSDNRLKLGRKIPISDDLKLVLEQQERSSKNVSPYSRNDVALKKIQELGESVGIKVTLYMFRKTFGSIMAEAGVPAFDLAKIMGHRDISTTYKYYIDIQHETLRSSMAKMPKIGT